MSILVVFMLTHMPRTVRGDQGEPQQPSAGPGQGPQYQTHRQDSEISLVEVNQALIG